MPSYANPYAYTSPIGDALGNLAKTLMSGPSEADRIAAAEKALALKQTRESTRSVADMFANWGRPGFNRNAAVSEAIIAGLKPEMLSENERYLAANQYGAAAPQTDAAARGAGGAYSSTAQAFNIDQGNAMTRAANEVAEKKRQFDMTPQQALVNGAPAFVPQSKAFETGTAPIISETEQKGTQLGKAWGALGELPPAEQRVLGADAKPASTTPRNYVSPDGKNHITYDGITDAANGAPLPAGGYIANAQGPAKDVGLNTSVVTGLQKGDIANQNLGKLLDFTEKQINDAPDVNFGASGLAKDVVQNVAIAVTNVATGLNLKKPQEALAALQKQAAAAGVDQSIVSGAFDPKIGALNTTYGLLVYATASALAGQNGRDLSNADVIHAKDMVGDPLSLFSNKPTLLSKLATIRTLLNIQQSTIDQNLGKTPAGPTQTTNQPAPVVKENWVRDPATGKLMRAQ